MAEWHSAYVEEIFRTLATNEGGLTTDEAERRLRHYGANEFQEFKRKGVFAILRDQFKGIFILLLVGAGIISLALGHTVDAAILFAVVLLNTVVGFFQEYRADQTFRLLQQSLEEHAVVFRDNEEREIPRRAVVPGDILILERGKRVPADARLVAAHRLLVNESSLSGEWLPVKKEIATLAPETVLSDRTNMVYLGTLVEDGAARAVTVATGNASEFGKIGTDVQSAYDVKTPLEKSIARFSFFFGAAVFVVIAALAAVGVMRGVPLYDMFLSAVALAVAAVPEGLAISVTIILAVSMRRILKKDGLVRRLFAAETLGSVSVIATDKTGTLTEARMQVSHILTGTKELFRDGARIPGIGAGEDSESHLLALRIVAATSEAVIENPDAETEPYRIRGRPTDRALLEAALEAGIRQSDLESRGDILDRFPFSEDRKYSAAILRGEKRNMLGVVGAPEVILAASNSFHIDGHVGSLDSQHYQKCIQRYTELVRLGLRVVAVAHAPTRESQFPQEGEMPLPQLSLVGFIAMRDPVRLEVRAAMELAHAAGIRTAVVTGDHALTARVVAEEAGLSVSDAGVLEGRVLAAMPDTELRARVLDARIFARVSPADKVRIVDAYQKNGEVVAMVGDGINDAPALKRADIGVALGSGTDIAKDASDLVLQNNSFATIVEAVREGRTIIENIRKTLTFLLLDGFTEIVLVGLSIVLALPLPLLPAQILWVNLIEDSLPSLAFAFEKGDSSLMRERPEKKLSLLPPPFRAVVVLYGLLLSVSTFLLFFWYYTGEESLAYARTMALALVAIDSLFTLFGIKNLRVPVWRGSLVNNPLALLAFGAGTALLAAAIHVPALQVVLKTVPLQPLDWAVVIGYGCFALAMLEAMKALFLKKYFQAEAR